MKIRQGALIATVLLFGTASLAGAGHKGIPNQDNVSYRADDSVKNPKTEKKKQTAAAKRAQLRKERDSLRTITVINPKGKAAQ